MDEFFFLEKKGVGLSSVCFGYQIKNNMSNSHLKSDRTCNSLESGGFENKNESQVFFFLSLSFNSFNDNEYKSIFTTQM